MTILPTDAKLRKQFPVGTMCRAYFPDALLAVSHLCYLGNEQHHPGTPLHWDKAKSPDHADAGMRHDLEGDLVAKAWRALAELQIALENGYKPWPYINTPASDTTPAECSQAAECITDDTQPAPNVSGAVHCEDIGKQISDALVELMEIAMSGPKDDDPPDVKAGLPKLPDGWVYYGLGPIPNKGQWGSTSACDDAAVLENGAWDIGGWWLDYDDLHYALRRGSKIAKLNGLA